MERLEVKYSIVTPLFLAGADQGKAEVRAPSIKGALRYWYRAVAPRYNLAVPGGSTTYESELFGGTGAGEGQARFLIRTSPVSLKEEVVDRESRILRGVDYLGFSLKPQRDRRTGQQSFRSCIVPGQDLRVSFLMRPVAKKGIESLVAWKSLIASIWLLGHVGGLGSRSRRGFGTVSLKEWRMERNPAAEKLLKELPIACNTDNIEKWYQGFRNGLSRIQSWFDGKPIVDHTVIDPQSSFFYHPAGAASWTEAMRLAGEYLKEFRKENRGGRMALGLPMMVPKRCIRYEPEGFNRVASPVWIRVIRAGERFYPFFALLSAPYPSKLKEKGTRRNMADKEYSAPDMATMMEQLQSYLKNQGFRGEGDR